MAALGSLVVKLALEYASYTQGLNKSEQDALKFGRAAQGAMDSAKKATADFLGGIVTGALAAIASYQSVMAVIDGVKASIDRLDAISKASQRFGVAASELQAMAYAGDLSDVSIDSLGTSMKKLSTFMLEAAAGGKEQAGIFKALGIEARGADGSIRSTTDVMGDLAERFAELEDGPVKTALAIKLFGKAGADMIPLLNGGKEALKGAADEAARFGLVIEDQTLKQAEAVNDNLSRLGKITEGTFNQISSAALPVLVQFTDAMVAAASGTDSMNAEAQRLRRDGTLQDWAQSAVTGITYVMDAGEGVVRVLKAVGQIVGGITAYSMTSVTGLADAFSRVIRGDFAGAYQALTANGTKLKTILSEVGSDLDATFGTATFGAKIRDRMADLAKFGGAVDVAGKKSKGSAELIAALGNNAAKTGKQVDEAAKAFEKWTDQLAKYGVELDAQYEQTDKLSKAEAWLAELTANATKDVQALTEANRRALIVETQLIVSKEKRNRVQQDEEKWILESAAANEKAIESARMQADAYAKEADALEEQHAQLGMNTEQIARREAARLRDLAASKLMLASMLPETEQGIALAEAYRLQAQRLYEVANAKLDIAQDQTFIEAQRREAQELQRINDEIGQGLANALMQGGKSAWEYIKGLFRTMVLQPVIKGIVSPLVGEASNLLTGNGGQGGGVGAISSLYTAGKGAYSWLTGGTAAAGTAAAGSGTALATNAALADSAVGTAGYGASSAGAGGGAGAAGSSSIGAYAGYAALIYAAAKFASSLYNKGFTGSENLKDNGWYKFTPENFQTKSLKAIGLSDKWAEILGGSVRLNHMFGRAAPRIDEQGYAGTLAGGQFSGSAYADIVEKGGLFRSDKRYTQTEQITDGFDKMLSDAAMGILESAKEYGKALGLPVDALKDVSSQIRIKIGEDAAENEKAIIEALGGYGDALVAGFEEAVKPLSNYGETTIDTVRRVGSAIKDVNEVLDTLGLTALQASIDGGRAAVELQAMFGDLGTLQQAAGGYLQNYYSSAERASLSTEALGKTLDKVGLTLPTTRDEFRKLVEAQDLTTESGRQAFTVLLSVADAFAAITPSAEDLAAAAQEAADAAQEAADAIAELQRNIRDGLSSVIADFVGNRELATFRAGEVQSTLAGAGINVSIEQILGSNKGDIVALWKAVGDEGKAAILEAYGAWTDMRAAIESADIAAIVEPLGTSLDELLGAYAELTPAADNLVASWRSTRDELAALKDALAEIDGTQAVSALDALRAAIGKRDGLKGVIGGIDDRVLALRVGQGGSQAVDLLKKREASLWREFASTSNPAVAQAITETTLQRIQLEGSLQDDANRTQIDALKQQISAAERLRDIAADMGQFVLSLKAGSLSNLSYTGRLSASRQLFEGAIATGGDVQGQAQAYLTQAQQVYGGSTGQYSAIFDEVTARLEGLGLTGGGDAASTIDTAQTQLDALLALGDTSDEQIVALGELRAQFGTSLDGLDAAVRDLRAPLDAAVLRLEAIEANQAAQILQAGDAYTRLIGEQVAGRVILDRIDRKTSLNSAQPVVV